MTVEYVQCENGALLVLVDLGIYTLSALLKTAYLFTGRCYMHLQYRSERVIEVRFRSKEPSEGDLETLVRQFCNEVLDHTLRAVVARESEAERNLILAYALSRHPVLNPRLGADDTSGNPERINVAISQNARPQS